MVFNIHAHFLFTSHNTVTSSCKHQTGLVRFLINIRQDRYDFLSTSDNLGSITVRSESNQWTLFSISMHIFCSHHTTKVRFPVHVSQDRISCQHQTSKKGFPVHIKQRRYDSLSIPQDISTISCPQFTRSLRFPIHIRHMRTTPHKYDFHITPHQYDYLSTSDMPTPHGISAISCPHQTCPHHML